MLDFCKVKAAMDIVNEGDPELNSRRGSKAYCYYDTHQVGEFAVACLVANTLLDRMRLHGRFREAKYTFRIIHRFETLESRRDQTQVHSSACLESQSCL